MIFEDARLALKRLNSYDINKNFSNAKKIGKRGYEICGLLIQTNICISLLPIRNGSKNLGEFWITAQAKQNECRKRNISFSRIVGTYHSHPLSGIAPGESDIRGAQDGELMLIFDCWDNKIGLWRIFRGEAKAQSICLSKI